MAQLNQLVQIVIIQLQVLIDILVQIDHLVLIIHHIEKKLNILITDLHQKIFLIIHNKGEKIII